MEERIQEEPKYGSIIMRKAYLNISQGKKTSLETSN